MPIRGSHAVGQFLCATQHTSSECTLYKHGTFRPIPLQITPDGTSSISQQTNARSTTTPPPHYATTPTRCGELGPCLDRVVVGLVELPELPVGRLRIPPGVAAGACIQTYNIDTPGHQAGKIKKYKPRHSQERHSKTGQARLQKTTAVPKVWAAPTTIAPAAESLFALARPMPVDAPVISTTLPVIFCSTPQSAQQTCCCAPRRRKTVLPL